jgi:hypothetical protein
VSDFQPLQQPYSKTQCISLAPERLGSIEELSWQVDVELLNGPYLVLGHSIPLRIHLTKLCDDDCHIWLNDYQSMLIETTQVRAQSSSESSNRFWIVQTMASMKRKICSEDIPVGTVICPPADI